MRIIETAKYGESLGWLTKKESSYNLGEILQNYSSFYNSSYSHGETSLTSLLF